MEVKDNELRVLFDRLEVIGQDVDEYAKGGKSLEEYLSILLRLKVLNRDFLAHEKLRSTAGEILQLIGKMIELMEQEAIYLLKDTT